MKKRIVRYLKPYFPYMLMMIFCAFITVASSLIIPVLTGRAIDQMIDAGKVEFSKLKTILFIMVVVVVVTMISQWLTSIMNNHIVYHVVKDIRVKAFHKITRLPLSYVDSHSKGDMESRVISDIETFSDGLLMGFTQLFTGVLTIIGTLCFMFYESPWITLVVIVLTPLSLLLAMFVSKFSYKLFHKQSDARGKMTGLVDEMVTNQKLVKIFEQEEENQALFEKLNQEYSTYNRKATFVSSLTNPGTRFVNAVVYAAVAVTGSYAVLHQVLTLGRMTAFLGYASQYTKPFNEISGVVTELQNAFACAARVFELMDEDEVVESTEAGDFDQEVKGQVDFEHVSFSYVEGQSLIEDLNIHVDQAKRVAIVGPTGCGKSTLINLLMRFYEVNWGAILVDGKDIRQVTRKNLRNNYGMVLQETWLKTATVAENIAYGKPDASREEIIAAAHAAHAHHFIVRLSNGYDTVISEELGNLSGGEKQLLCIARLMLKLPPMLILDEATSSIDTRTEILVQDAFAKMMQGRTSFVVAHRLSTIQNADLILVMKDGKIIEQGNHKELLAKNGFYASLYQI